MAIAFVGSATAATPNSTSTSITVAYASSGGQLIISIGSIFNPPIAKPATQIVDDGGNIWTQVGSQPQSMLYATISPVTAPITTVTISGLASSAYDLVIAEYSGVSGLKLNSTVTTGTSTTSSISATLSAGGNWLVSSTVHTGSTAAFTAATGNLRNQVAAIVTRRTALIDNTAATAISVTLSATLISQPWFNCIVELCAAPTLAIVNGMFDGLTSTTNSFATTALSTLPAGRLLLLTVFSSGTIGGVGVKEEVPQVSTASGLLFQQLALLNSANPLTASNQRCTMYYAIVPSSTAVGVITFSFTNNQARCAWIVDVVSGQDATNSINWLVQMLTFTGSGTTFGGSLNALQDSASLCYSMQQNVGTTPANNSPASGFAVLCKNNVATFLLCTAFAFNNAATTWTGTTTQNYQTIAIEITAANTFLVNNPLKNRNLGCPQL